MIHRRLLQLAGAVPGAIALLAACGVLISALHVAYAFALASAITGLVLGRGDTVTAFVTTAVLALARAVMIWARDLLAARVGATIRIRLRRRLLDRLVAVPAADRDSGVMATTVLDGVEGLDPYYSRYLPQLLVVLVVPAVVVVLVWSRSPAAGTVLAITAALAVLAPRFWDARLLRTGRTRWDRLARLSSAYVEALQNIPLLRVFGAGDRAAARFLRQADDLRDATMAQLRLSLIETGLSALAMHLGTVLAVIAALVAVTNGSATAASAVVVLLLARECFRPVQDLGTNWHAGYLGLTAVDGLDRLLGAAPIAHGRHGDAARLGTVEIASASYRYPGTDRGLEQVSVRVEAGECVAITGPSGSGKSTIARLLERDIDPDSGSVGIDGTDLRDLTSDALARSVVVVAQDPVLFARPVRECLRLYRPDASDAEVERATRAADIHDTISALPGGYDTVLAENGEQLSGGQRQRLAIARALLSTAPVLVLDEVTSALDPATERRVVDGVATLTRDRTVVVIAHRESACRHATRHLRVGDGRIVTDRVTPSPTTPHRPMTPR